MPWFINVLVWNGGWRESVWTLQLWNLSWSKNSLQFETHLLHRCLFDKCNKVIICFDLLLVLLEFNIIAKLIITTRIKYFEYFWSLALSPKKCFFNVYIFSSLELKVSFFQFLISVVGHLSLESIVAQVLSYNLDDVKVVKHCQFLFLYFILVFLPLRKDRVTRVHHILLIYNFKACLSPCI